MKKYLREITKRKDLVMYLVTSGLKAQHRNSYLGYLWWLLDPLLGIAIYYFLMVVLLDRGGSNYGGFLVIGMVVWRWLTSTVNSATKSIVSQSGIITKVYLPKAIFPIGASITQLINFLFGLLIVVGYMVVSRTMPGTQALWLPVVMLVQYVFQLALALIVAYVNVFIRDLDITIGHLIRIWFYSSPVIWEKARVPENYYWIVKFNPMAELLTSYRNILMNTGGLNPLKLAVIGVGSFLIVVFLLYYYSRNEHKFIKVL